ncbi:MAG TPA: hypothetical protein VIO80_14800 [Candidatus Dormibacteraeota bacterium]
MDADTHDLSSIARLGTLLGAKGLDAGSWGLDFVDSRNGFWTICSGPPGPCMGGGLFKTTDAGRSWTQIEETVK